jgi:hypothetical protein
MAEQGRVLIGAVAIGQVLFARDLCVGGWRVLGCGANFSKRASTHSSVQKI